MHLRGTLTNGFSRAMAGASIDPLLAVQPSAIKQRRIRPFTPQEYTEPCSVETIGSLKSKSREAVSFPSFHLLVSISSFTMVFFSIQWCVWCVCEFNNRLSLGMVSFTLLGPEMGIIKASSALCPLSPSEGGYNCRCLGLVARDRARQAHNSTPLPHPPPTRPPTHLTNYPLTLKQGGGMTLEISW